ncbi:MAG: hydrogenase maturation protease [Anaerolineae bacterium]|nr:hydrogenase maturation protease [Anaerolineae bacterium]MEB2286479.1 hydrogenase maturation protease [Anaerolineae bacterium]
MAADTQGDTLILGVGNPLKGDDGAGVLVVQRLLARPDLPPGVTVLDGGTAGLGLIPLIENYRRVVLVDAALMGETPGTVRRFAWREARVAGHERPLSLHQSDLADALTLAEALGSLPPEVIVFGVQPQHTDWEQPLSEAVARALPDLIEALLSEVRS